MLKVGDKIYCYSSLIVTVNGSIKVDIDFTIGKVYIIYNINGSFSSEYIKSDNRLEYVWVKNDKGVCDWFSILENHIWYIGNNFHTESEVRRNKLSRLKNVGTL